MDNFYMVTYKDGKDTYMTVAHGFCEVNFLKNNFTVLSIEDYTMPIVA